MIKANELRIGNKLYYKKEIISVSARNIYEIQTDIIINGLFSPIPLTEEWMLKLGFEEEKPDNEFTFGERWKINSILEIVPTGNPYNVFVINNDRDDCSKVRNEIKYVHQLQNLYFALTGEELEVKELKTESN